MKGMDYHSALKSVPSVKIDRELGHHSAGGNHVLRLDVCNNDLPAVFEQCDVLYTEPPWRSGYGEFINRAACEQSTYANFTNALNKIVTRFRARCAIWFVLGAHVLKHIIEPEMQLPTTIHGYKAFLCGWNDHGVYLSPKTHLEFIKELARDHERVGDFCAGYGNTGRIFQEAGKHFVLSDINGKCIYHIATTLMGFT